MKTLKYLKIIFAMYSHIRASLVAQLVESARMQETQVRFLDREDLLEKEMATYSSILAWRIPWTEEPGRLQSMGSQESDPTEWLSTNTHTYIRRPDRTQETKNPGNRTMDESFTFYISIYVVTLFIGQIKTVTDASSLALCKVKTNQSKALSFGAERGPLQCHARRLGGSCPEETQTLWRASAKHFQRKTQEICMGYYYMDTSERSSSRGDEGGVSPKKALLGSCSVTIGRKRTYLIYV